MSRERKRWIKGMRDTFSESLYKLARRDKKIILLTADTGAICHDDFKKRLKNQYINTGIAEQNMVGVAAGLAMSGRIVYIYGIVPFVTKRCYEQIRVDLCCMNLPVTIVGIGPGFDYSTLGPTHHGTEDIALMRVLPKMAIYSPADSIVADLMVKITYEQTGPKYLRLDRTGSPLIYEDKKDIDISKGFSQLKKAKNLYIIATGRMVYSALQAAKKLTAQSINTGVIDLFRIKPLNEEMLWEVIRTAEYLVSLEEHFTTGGIGSALAEMLAAKKDTPAFKCIGIPNRFCRQYGTREYLQRLNELDVDSITKNIKKWIKSRRQ